MARFTVREPSIIALFFDAQSSATGLQQTTLSTRVVGIYYE
jgi:hypothetical protein